MRRSNKVLVLAAVGLMVSGAAVAQPATPGALGKAEIEREIVGHSVSLTEGAMTWYFNRDGTYDGDDGRVARSGRYQVRADGRLCWNDNTGVDGCFGFYRKAAQLHLKRADPDNTAELGVVRVGPMP